MKLGLKRITSLILAVVLVTGIVTVGFSVSAETQTETSTASSQNKITATTTLNDDGSINLEGVTSLWGWLSNVKVVKGNVISSGAGAVAAMDAVASKSIATGTVSIGSDYKYSFTLKGSKVTTAGYTVLATDGSNAWAMCYVPSPAGTVEGIGGTEEEEPDIIGDGTVDVTAVKNADGSVTFAGTVALGNYIDKIVFKKGNTIDKIELTYASGTILSSWAPNHSTLLGTVHSGNSVTFSVTFTGRDVSEVGYTIVTKDRWEGTPYTAAFIPTQGGTGEDLTTYYGKGVSDETLKQWCTIAKNNKHIQCFAVNSVEAMLAQLGEPARTQNADKDELIAWYTEVKPVQEYQYDEYFLNDYYVQGVWDTMPANYGWMQDQYTTPGKWVAEHFNLGQRGYGIALGGNNPWVMLDYIERNIGVSGANTDGWLYGYDEEAEAPYLWHKETGMFLTYENQRSLKARIDYINQNNLGGCIIWEMSGDNTDTYPMTKMLAEETGKRVVGYFVNWAVYNDYHQKQTPTDLPWDLMTHINYSFMQIENNKIASMDDWADTTGALDYGAPAMFEKVAMMKEMYPDTKVLLSIGGWTRGDTFHAMVSSPANRATFINSVVEYLKKYPQFDGIDFDWEYPGNTPRAADHDDPNDRGCPTGTDTDYANYTAIVTELRTALDREFGSTTGQNIITACAPADPNKIDRQNVVGIAEACDFVNVMTYDYHGAFDPVGVKYDADGNATDEYWTLGYNSPLYPHSETPNEWSTDNTIKYLLSKGIPAEKMNIGTPYYSRGWAGIPTIVNEDNMEVPAGIVDKTPFNTEDIEATSITVNPTQATLEIGSTASVTATVLPENTTNKAVTWSSSNEAVATVDSNGLVTAIAAGTATITAKTSNNLTATCTVTVNEKATTELGFAAFKVGTLDVYHSYYGVMQASAQTIIRDGRAYVAMREGAAVCEASCDYTEVGGVGKIMLTYPEYKAEFTVGGTDVSLYFLSGELYQTVQIPADQVPVIVDGRTYLPARVLGQISCVTGRTYIYYISNDQTGGIGEYVIYTTGQATEVQLKAMAEKAYAAINA